MTTAAPTAAGRSAGLPRPRRIRVAVAGVTALTLGAALAATFATHSDGASDQRVRDASAYQSAIAPILRAGGEVIELGMKPGLREIAQAQRISAELRSRVASWGRSVTGVKARFDAVPVPVGLERIQAEYDGALTAYLRVADDLRAAVETAGAGRGTALARAAADGSAADRLYDAAQRDLAAVFARHH